MMTTFDDWTEAIKSYGESRGWRPLPPRHALKGFCEEAGIERRRGFAADRAFRLGYAALAAATPEERTACRDFEAVKQLQRKQQAEEETAREARERAAQERVEQFRTRRCWRLAGFYADELSMACYTLDELESWRDWAAYLRFTPKTFSLYAICQVAEKEADWLWLNWTQHFESAEMHGNRTFDFDEICQDLHRFTEDRRRRAAREN